MKGRNRQSTGSLVQLTPQASISKAGTQKKPEASISKARIQKEQEAGISKAGIQEDSEASISKAGIHKELEAGISKVGIQEDSEASISKAGIQKEREASIGMLHSFCECCLEDGHQYNKCPYRFSVDKDAKVGPGWVIVCHCCWKQKSHPNDDKVRRRAIMLFCARCQLMFDHLPEDCSKPPPPGYSTWLLCKPGLRD